MDVEDLLPRLLLFGGVTAALVIYTRRRSQQHAKHAAAPLAEAAAAVAEEAPGATLAGRGQNVLESVLDNVAEQALKELKGVLKDGLKRLEEAVDSL